MYAHSRVTNNPKSICHYHNKIEYEAFTLILQKKSQEFIIKHIPGYADDHPYYDDLDIKHLLNVDSKIIATMYAKKPINK